MKVTPEQIARLKDLLQSGADADFFFSSIRSADWVPALLENGYFDSPPKAEHGGDWVRYPAWPQSRYLARVAAQNPMAATEAALRIPATDNASVNDDILHIALAVPADEAVRLLPRIADWAKEARWRWGGIRDIAALIVHLAKADAAGARALLRTLIAFQPDPEAEEKKMLRQPADLFAGLEPRNNLSAEDYHELLKIALPEVLARDPFATLQMLATILNRYLRNKIGREAPPTNDNSLYWRPSVADHHQNPDHRQITFLVSGLYRGAEEMVRSGALTIDDLFSVTRAFCWDIFRRLELHWTCSFLPQIEPAKWKALLLDPDFFFNGEFDLEYGHLLKAAFAKLTAKDQSHVIAWAQQGPREEELKWMRLGPTGEPDSPEFVERRIAYWRVSRLIWIKDQLPPAVRTEYDAWMTVSSEPEHPGFHVWTGPVEMGSKSPTTLKEFKAMPLAAQRTFLRDWIPERSTWNGPTREGLASTLQAAIVADPLPYFEQADEFIGCDPDYISAVFRGLGEGLKGKSVADWAPFWRLANWVLAQPDPVVTIMDELTNHTGPGRKWCTPRIEIARMAEALVRGESIAITARERKFLWVVIETLAEDPNPTPAEDRPDARGDFDPYTQSLNTVRGEAVHAIFHYMRWVRRQAPGTEPDLKLDDLPEARAALERRLAPKIDPSPAIRSVFGANLGWLAFAAEDCVRRRLPAIFPATGQRPLYRAVWETYIMVNPASSKLLELLRSEYARAITHMSKAPEVKSRHEDPRVALGQHLVANYWWGNLEFSRPDDLLVDFYHRAPQAVRSEVMAFIGRSVAQTKEPLPPDIRDRLIKFWEWRLRELRVEKKFQDREELAKFLWWFDSGKFDPAWAARQMVTALELSHATEFHSLWMKRLAEIAAEFPLEAVTALELTLQFAEEKAEPFWEDEEAMAIFKAVANTGDPEILSRALRAQDILLRMGKRQYSTVLPVTKPGQER
jgi:hypothetical protein